MSRPQPVNRWRVQQLPVLAPAILALSLTLGSGTGCSFAFTDAPPARHAELPYFDCTSSRFMPNADLAVAALYAVMAVTTLSKPSERRDTDLVGGSLLMTGVFGTSAVHGYRRTAACREAKAQLAERMGRRQREEEERRLYMPDPWQAEGPPPAAASPYIVPAPVPGPAPVPVPAPAPAGGTPAPVTPPTLPAAEGRP